MQISTRAPRSHACDQSVTSHCRHIPIVCHSFLICSTLPSEAGPSRRAHVLLRLAAKEGPYSASPQVGEISRPSVAADRIGRDPSRGSFAKLCAKSPTGYAFAPGDSRYFTGQVKLQDAVRNKILSSTTRRLSIHVLDVPLERCPQPPDFSC